MNEATRNGETKKYLTGILGLWRKRVTGTEERENENVDGSGSRRDWYEWKER